jgi:hypothetical protein
MEKEAVVIQGTQHRAVCKVQTHEGENKRDGSFPSLKLDRQKNPTRN